MGRVASMPEVLEAIEQQREQGAKVALTNGAFDLLHVGHVRYLLDARRAAESESEGPIVLLVAVNTDDSVRMSKGPDRPHIPEDERAEIVAAIRGVDWVFLFGEKTAEAVIQRVKPDFQIKGTDYTVESVPERPLVESLGGKVLIAGDPKDHSTTEILGRMSG